MSLHSSLRSRSGASWFTVLVFFSLAAVVATMLLPMMCMVDRRGARLANCGNNQRQIVLAMVLYGSDHDELWPVFAARTDGWQVTGDRQALDPTATAIASLEFLVAATGGELETKAFACPAAPTRRPAGAAHPALGKSAWLSAWANAGPQQIGYGYDWSVPRLAVSVHAVTADRAPTSHEGRTMVAYADGHVGVLRWRDGHFRNHDADDDEIYDQIGDGLMTTPGMGSTSRAWIR